MPEQHIPLIMEFIDKIVSPDDRKRKFTDRQIVKNLILLQIFRISYRSSAIFLRNHEEYMEIIGIHEIPSFQTLSKRARSLDMHTINREIASLYTMESIAAIDSFMIHTCKYSTASRRKLRGNYKDPESGWSKTTKGWSYGRKCHVAMDVDVDPLSSDSFFSSFKEFNMFLPPNFFFSPFLSKLFIHYC